MMAADRDSQSESVSLTDRQSLRSTGLINRPAFPPLPFPPICCCFRRAIILIYNTQSAMTITLYFWPLSIRKIKCHLFDSKKKAVPVTSHVLGNRRMCSTAETTAVSSGHNLLPERTLNLTNKYFKTWSPIKWKAELSTIVVKKNDKNCKIVQLFSVRVFTLLCLYDWNKLRHQHWKAAATKQTKHCIDCQLKKDCKRWNASFLHLWKPNCNYTWGK